MCFLKNSVFFLSALVIFILASQLYRPKNHGDFFLFTRDYFRPIIMPMQKFLQIYKTDFMFHFHLCVQIYNILEKWYSYFFFLLHLLFPYYVYIKKVKFSAPSSTKNDNKIRLIKSIWDYSIYYLKLKYTEIMHASFLIRPYNYIPLKI